MLRSALWASLVLTAIACVALRPDTTGPSYRVIVENFNWHATHFRVYCDGTRMADITPLVPGQRYVRTLQAPRTCGEVVIGVIRIAQGEALVRAIRIPPSSVIEVRLEENLRLSKVTWRPSMRS